jgi:hypothetical protein
MGIFGKPTNSIGEVEASSTQLRRNRDMAAKTLVEAEVALEKAEIAWQAALNSDDSKALEKAGARLAGAKEFAAHLEEACAVPARSSPRGRRPGALFSPARQANFPARHPLL